MYTILDILPLKKIDDSENIYSVNPLNLGINHVSGYIGEKGVNKYLIFDSTDENKDLLKKHNVWNGNKNEKINGGKENDY